ncbi:hypothetical protein HBNXHr_0467 [Halorhabdus sp. BNX81]|nr:hypothetical protein HBNXHr_0467 [Halorhabdus sp. BNX81]
MDYIESLRDKYDLLVGLHIRQSDYREWHDGEFYYTAREYWDMAEAFAERSSAESMAFLIASDETHDNSIFDHDKYHMGLGDQDRVNHYVEDFVKLSHCDIVLAPPSTFSAFAAFLGDLPLVPLYEGVTNDGFQKLERPLLDSIDHPVMSSAIR